MSSVITANTFQRASIIFGYQSIPDQVYANLIKEAVGKYPLGGAERSNIQPKYYALYPFITIIIHSERLSPTQAPRISSSHPCFPKTPENIHLPIVPLENFK